jgi:hypothetical protein
MKRRDAFRILLKLADGAVMPDHVAAGFGCEKENAEIRLACAIVRRHANTLSGDQNPEEKAA